MDWKEKLGSRKLWVTIVGFVTAILIAFGIADSEIERVAAIIAAFGTLMVYLFGQAKVDAAVESSSQYHEVVNIPDADMVVDIVTDVLKHWDDGETDTQDEE